MSTTYRTTEVGRSTAVQAGGATEIMGGVAVVILAILALVGVIPRVLAPIAGIIFGAAFMVEGAAIAARNASMAIQAGAEAEVGNGVTLELVVGLAAIVLGILALIGIVTPVLMGALVITGGAGLVMSAGLITGLVPSRMPGVAQATVNSSAMAAHLLAGLAAIVLGIISLTASGLNTPLTSVALLVLGGSLTLSGPAVSTLMLRLFQQG